MSSAPPDLPLASAKAPGPPARLGRYRCIRGTGDTAAPPRKPSPEFAEAARGVQNGGLSLSPHDISRPILRQQWRNVTFLHWRIDTADAASLMPPGVVPDEFDGSS